MVNDYDTAPTKPVHTAAELEEKIMLTLLKDIDSADPKKRGEALNDYGMFTAAVYRRACALQAHTLTKPPVLTP